MTRDQIEEMFVRAAETEAKLPGVKGMREQWGKYPLAWFHDLGDINMRRVERTADERARLTPGDDPLQEWRMAWLSEWSRKATTAQVTGWEACMEIALQFIPNAKHRRALWAWAMAQAGTLKHADGRRLSFDRWCKEVECVSRWTGYDRKVRAIACLTHQLGGKCDLRGETLQTGALQLRPETGHVPATVPGVHEAEMNPTWRKDPAFDPLPFIDRRQFKAELRRRASAERRRKAEKVAA